jgi:(1->4)-alpha-D-glucan 1-alpha-D-glucosylmutase
MRGRVLAPFLGKFYGECLENGEIQLSYTQEGFRLTYHDLALPLRIESYTKVLIHNIRSLEAKLGKDHPQVVKFLEIAKAFRSLLPTADRDKRKDDVTFLKNSLWELYTMSVGIKNFVDENIQLFNGQKGNPDSFTLLDGLLSEQLYRLSFWKVATEEINYRRFFNINQLISMKVEEERVFRTTHAYILKQVWQDHFNGLRVDHIDGLYDPGKYLRRLREAAPDCYLVVEKILQSDEELPQSWPIEGTTGYDFLNYVNGVLCERRNNKHLGKIYSKFTGRTIQYDVLVADTKRLIVGRHMAGDIDLLAHMLKNISSRDRYARDTTLYGLRRALVEILALFPVYRTYVAETSSEERDRLYIKEAVKRARRTNPALILELNFIERFLLLDLYEGIMPAEKNKWIQFVMRFQQLSGPLMAKGFEDTALYIYSKLLSLNEVGGSPDKFGVSLPEFHRFNKKRANDWPCTMNATSTHDVKRGEDVRARINVLSELSEEWGKKIQVWRKINKSRKTTSNGEKIPDENDEYFFYQTLIGAFPFSDNEYPDFVERIKRYMIKAVREAKVHTAWLKPDETYEQGFLSFIEKTLKRADDNSFMNEFLPFQKKVAHYGVFNSLSQALLKSTCPGVPDFYQGSELWDLNLVDPDNRRPVDYRLRNEYLAQMKERETGNLDLFIQELLATKEDGRLKLFTIYRVLKTRNQLTLVFEKGDYVPLKVAGHHKDSVIAFARMFQDTQVITVAPRYLASILPSDQAPLGGDLWFDTRVALVGNAPAAWRHAFTNKIVKSSRFLLVADVLEDFPLGLLVGESGAES